MLYVQEDPRALVAAVVLVEAQHSWDGLVVDLIVDVEVDFSELTCIVSSYLLTSR